MKRVHAVTRMGYLAPKNNNLYEYMINKESKEMRREYVKPSMIGEMFTADEYCASCGEGGTTYKFKCNAGSPNNSYNVYLENGTPYATSGRDSGGCKTDYTGYHPCYDPDSLDGYHEADSDTGFLRGYMYKQGMFGGNTGSKIDVIIWTDNFTDVHCTTNLEMDKWEVSRS